MTLLNIWSVLLEIFIVCVCIQHRVSLCKLVIAGDAYSVYVHELRKYVKTQKDFLKNTYI